MKFYITLGKHCTFVKTEVSQSKPSKYTNTVENIRLSSHTWNAIRNSYMKNTHAAVWQRGTEWHKAFCCRSTAVVRGKVYLKLSSCQCNSGQFVKDCLDDKILDTTFYQLCYDVQTNEESKESVLEGILKLFFKIRIHNRCKLFMEARVQKQKTCLKK